MADLVGYLQLSLKNVCAFRYFFVTLAFLKAEGRLHPGNENKSRFILHFARFALPLQPDMQMNNKIVNIVLAVIAVCLLALCVASVMNVK